MGGICVGAMIIYDMKGHGNNKNKYLYVHIQPQFCFSPTRQSCLRWISIPVFVDANKNRKKPDVHLQGYERWKYRHRENRKHESYLHYIDYLFTN